MKRVLGLFVLATSMMAQSDPKPTTVMEPVTQPVLHCPDGWHVEVWHESEDHGTYLTNAPYIVMPSGYIPYSRPIEISEGIKNLQHPAKCVRNETKH